MALKNVDAEYSLVGRYMDGTEVSHYMLTSEKYANGRKVTREAFIYYVGQGKVKHVFGQVSDGKFLLRGDDTMDISSLPIVDASGALKVSGEAAKLRNGVTAESKMVQFRIVHKAVSADGKRGFIIANNGGATKPVSREDVIGMIEAGQISNARINKNGDKGIIIRLTDGRDMNSLQTVQV